MVEVDMNDQFLQIQNDESALEALEHKVSEAAGGNVAVEAADDMIRANGEAQAIEVDTLKDTVRAYQRQIEELKTLYEKNSALVEELRKMNIETTKGVQDVMKASSDALAKNSDALNHLDFSGIQTGIRSDVQTDTKNAIEASESKVVESVAASQQKLADLLQQSDDFAHKENVRVYRNVQAATDQLLKKQTEELGTQFEDLKKPQKPKISWIQIVILIFVAAGTALSALDAFGVFQLLMR